MTELKITDRQKETLIKVLENKILKAQGNIAIKTPTGRKIKGLRSLTPNYLSYCLDIVADLTPILIKLKGENRK